METLYFHFYNDNTAYADVFKKKLNHCGDVNAVF